MSTAQMQQRRESRDLSQMFVSGLSHSSRLGLVRLRMKLLTSDFPFKVSSAQAAAQQTRYTDGRGNHRFPETGKVAFNHTGPHHFRCEGGLALFKFSGYDILYFKEVIKTTIAKKSTIIIIKLQY